MTTITLAPGISFETLNPSWTRDWEMVERAENEDAVFFLCRFLSPSDTPPPNEFMRFGVAHVNGSDITETWPIIDPRGAPKLVVLSEDGRAELRRYLCPECKQYVRWHTRVLRRRVELIVTEYTCPKCEHSDVDYLD